MLHLLTALVAVPLLVWGAPVPRNEKPKAVTVTEAVKDFNQRAQNDTTGKAQPPLTEDEVVAAIRGWDRDRTRSTDEVYKVYQTIADTRKLPAGARLTFITRWGVFNEHEFDVWWVDLYIKTGPNSGYAFRIRDQKLRCRPLKK